MSQFTVFLDASGNLTMAAGVVHCLHGTTTFFPVGGGAAAKVPSLSGGGLGQRELLSGNGFHGGSGRNFIVGGGPANDDLPKGFYQPTVPNEFTGPKGATLTRDPGTGALSLHDGIDELATGSAIGGLVGVASAGTFPITDWELSSYSPGSFAIYFATGWLGWTITHDLSTGDVTVHSGVNIVAVRTGGSTTDPSGVCVATTTGEDDWNGGSAWNYTVSLVGTSGTLTATAYAETAYNGGSPFTLDIAAESEMPSWPNAAADFTPYAGTAPAAAFLPTEWQASQSEDDPDWTMTTDGDGIGWLSDGIDIVATRAADLSRLYDPSGEWVATPYGETTYNSGDAWAANVTRRLATPMEGTLYVELTLNGSNEVTAVTDPPIFGSSIPANSSTLKVWIIAESDGAGGIRQVWEGPISWVP